eukprot:gene3257-4106_t
MREDDVSKTSAAYDTNKWGNQYNEEEEADLNPENLRKLSIIDYKQLGDEACRAGEFLVGCQQYSLALQRAPESPVLYNNRSLAHHRLGEYQKALEDGRRAEELLIAENLSTAADADWIETLTKSYYRQAVALDGLSLYDDAILMFRKGLKAMPCEEGTVQAMRKALEKAYPLERLVEHFSGCIEEGQKPAALSCRDGKLLKPVFPEDIRLSPEELRDNLEAALAGHEQEAREQFVAAYARAPEISEKATGDIRKGDGAVVSLPDFPLRLLGSVAGRSKTGKHVVAAYRAWAYLKADEPVQAGKDAKVAIASSKSRSSPHDQLPRRCEVRKQPAVKGAPGNTIAGWSRANYVYALALEGIEKQGDQLTTVISNPGEGGRQYTLSAATSTAAAIAMRYIPSSACKSRAGAGRMML